MNKKIIGIIASIVVTIYIFGFTGITSNHNIPVIPSPNNNTEITLPNDKLEITLDKTSHIIGEKAMMNIIYTSKIPSNLTISMYGKVLDTIPSTSRTYEFLITNEFVPREYGLTVTDSNVSSSYVFEVKREAKSPSLKEFLPTQNEFRGGIDWMVFGDEVLPSFFSWHGSHLGDYKHVVETIRRWYIDPTYGPEVFIDRYDSQQAAQESYKKYVQTYLGSDLGNGCSDIYDTGFDHPVFTGVACIRDDIILVVYDFNHENEIKSNLLEIILEKIG